MAHLFSTFDALICPTTTKTAPLTSEKSFELATPHENGRLNSLEMTSVFNNVAVCPAISVPNWSLDDDVPTSVQIIGRRFDDPTVLMIASCLENQMPWPQWQAQPDVLRPCPSEPPTSWL